MPEHPAKYNAAILSAIAELLPVRGRLLDPFAGVGGCLAWATPERYVVGIELEPEWARQAPVSPYGEVLVGNALQLPFADNSFTMACTSPAYGNRMADNYHARDSSKRITYRHCLGHELQKDNSGGLQWGDAYRALHQVAWRELRRVLQPDAIFVLNCKDHIRKGVVQPVTLWQRAFLILLGFRELECIAVPCSGMGFGRNGQQRVNYENVILFRLNKE